MSISVVWGSELYFKMCILCSIISILLFSLSSTSWKPFQVPCYGSNSLFNGYKTVHGVNGLC